MQRLEVSGAVQLQWSLGVKGLKRSEHGVTTHLVLPRWVWVGSIPPIYLVAFIGLPLVYPNLY